MNGAVKSDVYNILENCLDDSHFQFIAEKCLWIKLRINTQIGIIVFIGTSTLIIYVIACFNGTKR